MVIVDFFKGILKIKEKINFIEMEKEKPGDPLGSMLK